MIWWEHRDAGRGIIPCEIKYRKRGITSLPEAGISHNTKQHPGWGGKPPRNGTRGDAE